MLAKKRILQTDNCFFRWWYIKLCRQSPIRSLIYVSNKNGPKQLERHIRLHIKHGWIGLFTLGAQIILIFKTLPGNRLPDTCGIHWVSSSPHINHHEHIGAIISVWDCLSTYSPNRNQYPKMYDILFGLLDVLT